MFTFTINKKIFILAATIICIMIIIEFLLSTRDNENKKPILATSQIDQSHIDSTGSIETDNLTRVTDDTLPKKSFDLGSIDLPQNTYTEIVNKGLPVIPNVRRDLIQELSAQSIEEAIENLGDLKVFYICGFAEGGSHNLLGSNIRWRKYFHNHMQVLRLIEEARKDPDRLLPLLSATLDQEILAYPEAYVRLWQPYETQMREEEYFLSNKRYRLPIADVERAQGIIYSVLFIYANIGYADGDEQLQKWVSIKNNLKYSLNEFHQSQFENLHSSSVDHWFTDVFTELKTKNYDDLPFTKYEQSRWNEPWPINHPMLAAVNVDTKDLKRIQILEIPEEY